MAKLITVERAGVEVSEAVVKTEEKVDANTFVVTTDVPSPRNFDPKNDTLEYYDGSCERPQYKIIHEYGVTKFKLQKV